MCQRLGSQCPVLLGPLALVEAVRHLAMANDAMRRFDKGPCQIFVAVLLIIGAFLFAVAEALTLNATAI